MSQVRLTDSIESPTKEKDKARTRNSMGITSDTTIARLQSNGFCSKESVISGDGGDSGGGDEDPPSSSIDSVDPFSLETYQPPRTRPRRTARQILEELTKDPETEIVSSSMPSVTSSAALAAGIEDIEGYLEQDLKGFTRLSY
ncbi:hypothetical protein EC991_010620 [Linnemannia zychae]|nr:hypothetical protein EC991_010620 [Linnemannia zychae]